MYLLPELNSFFHRYGLFARAKAGLFTATSMFG
jgi:hypothetical protein